MLINKQQLLHFQEEPSADWLPWLTHQDSLTHYLEERSQKPAELKVLNESWIQPLWWHQALGWQGENLFNREIAMFSQGQCCWYARSFFPLSTYQLDPVFFKRLEKEFLGALLFNEPKIQRKQLFHYHISPDCLEYHWAKSWFPDLEDRLWGRFAHYEFLNQGPIVLVEILRPAVLEVAP